MVTAVDITTYLENIKEAQSNFMDKLVRKEKLGHSDILFDRIQAAVLNCYVTIMIDYFSQAQYDSGYFITAYNFFDEVEIGEVILRINRLCDVDYYLDIE